MSKIDTVVSWVAVVAGIGLMVGSALFARDCAHNLRSIHAQLEQRKKERNMVHVNLSDVSNEFEVLPEGMYNAVLVDAEVIEQDEPKYPYIKWEYKYDDHGGKAWNNTSLSPNALFMLRATLEALGEEEDVLDEEEGFDVDPTDYIGEEVTLHITIGSYKGRETNNVEAVLPRQADEKPGKKKAKGGTTKKKRRKVV